MVSLFGYLMSSKFNETARVKKYGEKGLRKIPFCLLHPHSHVYYATAPTLTYTIPMRTSIPTKETTHNREMGNIWRDVDREECIYPKCAQFKNTRLLFLSKCAHLE